MPPWGWWPLAFVGVAWLHRLGTRASTRKRAFVSGTLFGIGWLLPATAWMWFISAPGWIVVALMYALLHGAAEAVAWNIKRVMLRPLAHVLVEAVRFSWPFGGIPLASIAISQSQSPVAPLVRIIGAIGITWFVWQFATNLVERRRHVLSLALAAIVVVAAAPSGVVESANQAAHSNLTAPAAERSKASESKADESQAVELNQSGVDRESHSATQRRVTLGTIIPVRVDEPQGIVKGPHFRVLPQGTEDRASGSSGPEARSTKAIPGARCRSIS